MKNKEVCAPRDFNFDDTPMTTIKATANFQNEKWRKFIDGVDLSEEIYNINPVYFAGNEDIVKKISDRIKSKLKGGER